MNEILADCFNDTLLKSDYEKQCKFIKWQYHNKYYGKQFSILGDSISTLAGYNPKGYKVFFDESNCEKASIHDMNDTWWGKVIEFFGGELLVNNSWSGSCVTGSNATLFPSGCSDERTSCLHINSVKPDVIIIYLGFNDWANGVVLDGTHFLEESLDLSYFVCAYNKMLEKVTSNYPNAEIWCCTLNTTYMSTNQRFKFPYMHGGIHIEEYNREIKQAANNYNCKIADLYKYNTPYDTIDSSHPNADGMNTLASLVIKEMSTEKANDFTSFLDAVESKTLTDSDEDDDFKNVDVGTILDGKYEILKLVGQSATSKVFLAKLLSLNKLVAVKTLNVFYKNNEQVRQALINEANILRQLEFPAIPNVLEIVEKNDNAFIVTDYIEGETLDTIVEEWGAQSVEKVIDWAIQLCDILEYLHSQEPPIIYRDVKPANFMLQPNGNIKVLDFGIARTYKSSKAADTNCLGTSGYAPPEQYGSAQTDRRSDIYSLGMTMYNICFGIAPKGLDFKVADQAQTAVEKDLLTVIKKCTQLNPNDRYRSCMELKNELDYLKKKGHLKKKFGLFKR